LRGRPNLCYKDRHEVREVLMNVHASPVQADHVVAPTPDHTLAVTRLGMIGERLQGLAGEVIAGQWQESPDLLANRLRVLAADAFQVEEDLGATLGVDGYIAES
jgi:hypothetical protein